MLCIALIPPNPSGLQPVTAICASFGARADPALRNEVVWTKGGEPPTIRNAIAAALGARWTREDGEFWLRPDGAARAAWDRADAAHDDRRFVAASKGPPAFDADAFRDDLARARRELAQDQVGAAIPRLNRLSSAVAAQADLGRSFRRAGLGAMEERETRIFGAGERPIPPPALRALRSLERLFLPLIPPDDETRLFRTNPRKADRVRVRRLGDVFSFQVWTQGGLSAHASVVLTPDTLAKPLGKILLSRASRLLLHPEALSPTERREVAQAVADEPLRLVVPDVLAAQFAEEKEPVVVVVPDRLLDDATFRGADALCALSPTDFAWGREDGILRVVPRRLEATRLARTDRRAFRALMLRLARDRAFETREACGWATGLHNDYLGSIARRVMDAVDPELSRFYKENPWPWVRVVGGLSRAAYDAASDGLSLARLTPPDRAWVVRALDGETAEGILRIVTDESPAFRIVLRGGLPPGVGIAGGDLTPEQFGRFLAAQDDVYGKLAKDGQAFRSSSIRLSVETAEGRFGGVVSRRGERLGDVVSGDLSGLDPSLRKRIEAARGGAPPAQP